MYELTQMKSNVNELMQMVGQTITKDDFVCAIRELDTFVDVDPNTLVDLTKKAIKYAFFRQLKHVLVKTVMTPNVITVSHNTLLHEAASMMVENRVSGLPVVAENHRLIGLITEADLLKAMGVPNEKPAQTVWETLEYLFHHLSSPQNLLNLQDTTLTVADLMTSNVITVLPNDTIEDVLELMKKYKIKRVIVADSEQRIQGMVSRSDLIKIILKPA